MNPAAPVAVCTLTGDQLPARMATLPGVAIAGTLATANLGIERIVVNVTANPAIRFLLLCGPDSALFQPGQALRALVQHGTTAEGHIREATGYNPLLRNVTAAQIAAFRAQITLVDRIGDDDLTALTEQIALLAAQTPPSLITSPTEPAEVPGYRMTKPGGSRDSAIGYDPAGYLLIRWTGPRARSCCATTPPITPRHTKCAATARNRCCSACSVRAWSPN